MMIPRIVTQYLPVYHHLPSLHPFISAIVVYMPGYNTCTSMSWCSPRVSISGTMFMCLTVELSNSAPSIVVFVVHMLTVGCTQNVWCSHILVVENKGLMRYSQGSHFFMLVIAQILGGGVVKLSVVKFTHIWLWYSSKSFIPLGITDSRMLLRLWLVFFQL